MSESFIVCLNLIWKNLKEKIISFYDDKVSLLLIKSKYRFLNFNYINFLKLS
jgi:hypothetical protein